jgi:cytochrome c
MLGFPDMMVAPVLPENPTQADYGRQVYYYVCMACHGNLGQGLTEEWVAEAGEGNSCWQSKCHASNHPPEGFELPRAIPGVVGPELINPFRSASSLHDYLRARMPWQAPGSLSEEKYWQVTAFLLELNGIDPGPAALDEQTAQAVVFGEAVNSSPAASKPGTVPWVIVAVLAGGGVVLLGLVLWVVRYTQRRQGR